MRLPQPFFRNFDGWWYVQVKQDGKPRQIKLAKGRDNEDAARRKYLKVLLQHDLGDPLDRDRYTVAQVCDAFLDWSEKNLSRASYDQQKHYLQLFCDRHGPVVVTNLKPFHVSRWVEEHVWSQHTIRDVIGIIKRAFNWAHDEGYIERNPTRPLKKPPPTARTRVLTDEEHRKIVEASGEDFQRFLTALRETGARPGEIASVTAAQVDLANRRWILRQHKTARKTQRPRIIYLSPAMHEMTRQLVDQNPDGPLFRTATGRGWTKDAIRLRFKRLRHKLDLSKDVTAYAYRHTFATNSLASGESPAIVAELMGHRDTAMLDRVYGHLNQKTELLQQAAARLAQQSECA